MKMVRRGLPRGCKGEETLEVEDQTNKDLWSKRRRPQEGCLQRAQKKGGRTNADRHAQLDEDVKREAIDPYHLQDPDHYPRCTREDHIRKKNCANNPRCLYGLGEGKQGIWSSNPGLLKTLGEDLSGMLKTLSVVKTPPNGSNEEAAGGVLEKGDGSSPSPHRCLPAGLKNLGATCYLNSQLQALFANKGFRRGVYAWRPSRRGAGLGRRDRANGNGVNGSSSCRQWNPGSSAEPKAESLGATNSSGGGRSRGTGCNSGVGVASGGIPKGAEVSEIAVVGVGGSSTEAVSGEAKDEKIMEELQRVFGHMQEGIAKVYDPATFANLLGIDNGIQQDPQEFNKLFMSLLERCLQRSAPPLRTLVSGLFCGELAYVTRCLKCKFASRNKNAFNELELQIGSNRTIGTCLDGFLEVESLDGDNQYLCEKCGRKQDAVRAIELHRLPPVLSIQLLRYVYDARTGQRKKIKAALSLAPTLDMGPRLGPQGEARERSSCSGSGLTPGGDDCVYKLACVLYHKGSNVHSGHYIAEVHDPSSNTWTLFDDEKVRRLTGMNSHGPAIGGAGPAGDAKPRGKAKRNPRVLQKKRDRGGGEAAEVAAAESDAEAEFLSSSEKVAKKTDFGSNDEDDPGLSSGEDVSETPPPGSECKGKGKGKVKSKAAPQHRTKVQRKAGRMIGQRAKRLKTVVEDLSPDEDIDLEKKTEGDPPKPARASSAGGRHKKGFSVSERPSPRESAKSTARAGRRANSGSSTYAGTTSRNGDTEAAPATTAEPKSRKVVGGKHAKLEILEGRAKKKDKDDMVEDDEGEVVEEEIDGAGDNAREGEAVTDKSGGDGDSVGSKKQRSSEDAYMLIYVREGVAWGLSSKNDHDSPLPAHVREAVEASNMALTKEVYRFREGKRRLEAQMRCRRERYCSIFGSPIKTAPAGRKCVDGVGTAGGGSTKGVVVSSGKAIAIVDGNEADTDDKGDCVRVDAVEHIKADPTRGKDQERATATEAKVEAAQSAQGGRRPSQCGDVEIASVAYQHPGPSDEQLSFLADTATTEVEADVVPDETASLSTPMPLLPPDEYFWVDSRWLQQWVVGERLPPSGEAAVADPVVVILDGTDEAEAAEDNDEEELGVVKATKGGVDAEGKGVTEINANGMGNGDVGGLAIATAAALKGDAGDQGESKSRVFAEPMRNLELLCDHGGLHPASVSRWKLVTRKVYEGLLGEEGVGPPDRHVSATNFRCGQCVKDHIGRKENNITASRERGVLVAELEKAEPAWDWDCSDVKRPFAISRKWIADFKLYHEQFLRSAAKDTAGSARGGGCILSRAKTFTKPLDYRVNSGITCEHGSLINDRKGLKRKYRLISAEGWGMVRKRFPLASELEYPAGTRPCSICQEQDEDETQMKLDRRKSKSAELQKGPTLRNILRRGGALPPDLYAIHRRRLDRQRDNAPPATNYRFFLAEAKWLAAWRAHHDSSSVHSEPPGRLLNQGLRCEHGLAIMGQRLRRVVEGHLPALAGVSEKGVAAEAEVLTEAEWEDLARCAYILKARTGGDGTKSKHSAGDETRNARSSDSDRYGEGGTPDGSTSSPSSGAKEGPGASCTFEVSFDPGSGWSPGVCEVCMSAASDRANMARSVFKDKAVNVVRLKEGELPPPPDPAEGSEGGDGVQLSASGRPQRRTRAKGAQPLVVTCSSDETVNLFKLKVYQAIEVPPRRQTLFLRASPVVEGMDTLQQAGVKAGDTLHLKVKKASESSDAVDDASFDDTQLFTEGLTTKPPPGPERGFAGTALSAGRIMLPPSVHRSPPSSPTPAVDLLEIERGYVEIPCQVPAPFVACPMCTFHNKLTEERCSACGVALFEY